MASSGPNGLASIEIGEPIAETPLFRVVEARFPGEKRSAILKVTQEGLLDAASVEACVARVATAADLRHPNLAALMAIEGEGDALAFVTELVEGQSLQVALDAGARPEPALAVRWAAQLARALDVLHARGLAHGAVRPANVLVEGKGGTAKLVDVATAAVQVLAEGSAAPSKDADLAGLAGVLGATLRADGSEPPAAWAGLLAQLEDPNRRPPSGNAVAALLEGHKPGLQEEGAAGPTSPESAERERPTGGVERADAPRDPSKAPEPPPAKAPLGEVRPRSGRRGTAPAAGLAEDPPAAFQGSPPPGAGPSRPRPDADGRPRAAAGPRAEGEAHDQDGRSNPPAGGWRPVRDKLAGAAAASASGFKRSLGPAAGRAKALAGRAPGLIQGRAGVAAAAAGVALLLVLPFLVPWLWRGGEGDAPPPIQAQRPAQSLSTGGVTEPEPEPAIEAEAREEPLAPPPEPGLDETLAESAVEPEEPGPATVQEAELAALPEPAPEAVAPADEPPVLAPSGGGSIEPEAWAGLTGWSKDQPCARVERGPGEPGPDVRGWAGDGATRGALADRAGALGGVDGVEIELLDPEARSHCRLFEVLAEHASQPFEPIVRLLPPRIDLALKGGDPLILQVRPAQDLGRVRVDYFAADGQVAHLLASDAEEAPSGEGFVLGDPLGGSWLEISPPFGREAIVAIRSAEPLFEQARPDVEPSDQYLNALAEALERAEGPVDATVLLIETSPRITGEAAEAAGR